MRIVRPGQFDGHNAGRSDRRFPDGRRVSSLTRRGPFFSSRAGDPDLVVGVDVHPLGPDEHPAADAADRIALREELDDRRIPSQCTRERVSPSGRIGQLLKWACHPDQPPHRRRDPSRALPRPCPLVNGAQRIRVGLVVRLLNCGQERRSSRQYARQARAVHAISHAALHPARRCPWKRYPQRTQFLDQVPVPVPAAFLKRPPGDPGLDEPERGAGRSCRKFGVQFEISSTGSGLELMQLRLFRCNTDEIRPQIPRETGLVATIGPGPDLRVGPGGHFIRSSGR